MTTGACVMLAFSSCLAALAALALAMDRHHEDAHGRGTDPGRLRHGLRLSGTVGLLVSLLASLAASGATQGWVLWFGVLTTSALTVVLILSFTPRWAPSVGFAAAVLATASVALTDLSN